MARLKADVLQEQTEGADRHTEFWQEQARRYACATPCTLQRLGINSAAHAAMPQR